MHFLKIILKAIIESSPKWIFWGFAFLCFGVFIEVFGEVYEAEHDDSDLMEFDSAVTNFIFSLRSPRLNQVAVDITALGSEAVITSVVIFLTILFLLRKKVNDAIHILAASALAGLSSQGFKLLVARDRPPLSARLVDVQGYSYPSGHSLAAAAVYLTIGLIFHEQFYNNKERVFSLSSMIVLIVAIGLSRIYLGVHYPSDVVGGISLGMGLAFLIFAFRRVYESARLSTH